MDIWVLMVLIRGCPRVRCDKVTLYAVFIRALHRGYGILIPESGEFVGAAAPGLKARHLRLVLRSRRN